MNQHHLNLVKYYFIGKDIYQTFDIISLLFLFYRKESRTIRLKNTKLIPVRWRLIGIGQDGIGQEFSTKTDTGIVEPLSTYELQLNYYASRPRSPASQKNKLQLKLEVNLFFIKNFF